MGLTNEDLEAIESPVTRAVLALLNLIIQVAKAFVIVHFVIKFW